MVKTLTQYIIAGVLLMFVVSCKKSDEMGTGSVEAIPVAPTLTTKDITSITSFGASTGGSISSSGSSAIITSGVCYSTNHNPTTSNQVVTSVSTTGNFTATISGLTANVNYYVRAFAINSEGVAGYGNELSFFTAFAIGQKYLGGTVFYVDNKGEHGLIVNPTNLDSATWGCAGTLISGTNNTVYSGSQNTDTILATCFTAGIAARLCRSLGSDWYLPSSDELNALYNQRRAINFFTGIYWTSTEESDNNAYALNFADGTYSGPNKSAYAKVIAIRSF